MKILLDLQNDAYRPSFCLIPGDWCAKRKTFSIKKSSTHHFQNLITDNQEKTYSSILVHFLLFTIDNQLDNPQLFVQTFYFSFLSPHEKRTKEQFRFEESVNTIMFFLYKQFVVIDKLQPVSRFNSSQLKAIQTLKQTQLKD